jgi:hypothetical protein
MSDTGRRCDVLIGGVLVLFILAVLFASGGMP